MYIDRDRAKKAFSNYAEQYDSSDEKIKLKIDHTYRVSELCEKIAENIGFAKEDIDLAWLIGLLHDVGRFEQLRRYGTFNDVMSIDHAKYGAEILFESGKIRNYVEDSNEDEVIRTVIEYHSAYSIPKGLSDRIAALCNILRDADKIDILKVNVIIPMEEIYNVTTEQLHNSVVTKEVMDNYKEERAILRKLKKVPIDHLVGHISLAFELVYSNSLKIVCEQGYLEKLLNFQSDNPTTNLQFNEIRERMHRYISRKIKEM